MNINRLWHSLRLYTTFHSAKRGEYLRKHKLFHHIGKNVRIPAMLLPLYPELISLGDNVELASGVKLVTHDAIHGVLRHKNDGETFHENIGCIQIGSNCFIGANSIVLGNVKIGDNVVVAAGSVINRDLPSGGVYGGIPARRLGDFDRLEEKRRHVKPYTGAEDHWREFDQSRQ